MEATLACCESSQSIQNITTALLAVQQRLTGVMRDADNPYHKSRYATLEAVITTARGPLNDNDIVLIQAPGPYRNGAQHISTRLIHAKSGEWIGCTLMVPIEEPNPQKVGSAVTYGCRYTLMALLGMPPVDDDAESAMGREQQGRKSPARDWDTKMQELQATQTPEALREWGLANAELVHTWPDKWQELFRKKYEAHMETLTETGESGVDADNHNGYQN